MNWALLFVHSPNKVALAAQFKILTILKLSNGYRLEENFNKMLFLPLNEEIQDTILKNSYTIHEDNKSIR